MLCVKYILRAVIKVRGFLAISRNNNVYLAKEKQNILFLLLIFYFFMYFTDLQI